MTDADLDSIPTAELIERLHDRQITTLGIGKGYQTTMTFSVCVTVEYKTDDGFQNEEYFGDLEMADEQVRRWCQIQREAWEAKQIINEQQEDD